LQRQKPKSPSVGDVVTDLLSTNLEKGKGLKVRKNVGKAQFIRKHTEEFDYKEKNNCLRRAKHEKEGKKLNDGETNRGGGSS